MGGQQYVLCGSSAILHGIPLGRFRREILADQDRDGSAFGGVLVDLEEVIKDLP